MLAQLRSWGACLIWDGPGWEVRLYWEGAPNAAPTWKELSVDEWEAYDKTVQDVDIGHRDGLVV